MYATRLGLDDSFHPMPHPSSQASDLRQFITKTYLYNFDPLKPHFYIVELGLTGVYIIFRISAQKHRLWVLVRTSTHNLCFEQKYEKYQYFLSDFFSFLVVKISIYLNRCVFVMSQHIHTVDSATNDRS